MSDWKFLEGGFRGRLYADYPTYIEHQKSKLQDGLDDFLKSYHVNYRRLLRERLEVHEEVRPGSSVLCLGARSGAECEAFAALGCFAIGVDLLPTEASRWVVTGDFHSLQFPDDCVEIIFTNAVDHAFDFAQFLSEIERVLKPDGLLIVEASAGEQDFHLVNNGLHPQEHEAVYWEHVDDVVALIHRVSFELLIREPYKKPWPGEHLVFERSA